MIGNKAVTYFVKYFCGIFMFNHILTSHNTTIYLEDSLWCTCRLSVIPGLIKKRNFNIFHAKKVLELTHQMKRQKIKDCEGKKKKEKKKLQWNSHQDCKPDILCIWCLDSRLYASPINTNWLEKHFCTSLFLISMTVLLDSRKKFLDINNQFPNYFRMLHTIQKVSLNFAPLLTLFNWTVFSNCNQKKKG